MPSLTQNMNATDMFQERSQEDGCGWDSYGRKITGETRTGWGRIRRQDPQRGETLGGVLPCVYSSGSGSVQF